MFDSFTERKSVIKGFIPPEAGSTAFVELDIEETALEFSNNLVANTGIMTVPCELFEFEGKYIRVGFGRENFSETLDEFERYLVLCQV